MSKSTSEGEILTINQQSIEGIETHCEQGGDATGQPNNGEPPSFLEEVR